MEGYFFKKRKNFDFNPNEFDLGIFLWQTESHLDMHFLNKIVKINLTKHASLYDHHKNYYLEAYPDAQEKVYFEKLYDLVDKNKTKELQKDSIKLSPKQKYKSEGRIKKYEDFIDMMKVKDKWGFTNNMDDKLENIDKNSRIHQSDMLESTKKVANEIKKIGPYNSESTKKITEEIKKINKNHQVEQENWELIKNENKRLKEELTKTRIGHKELQVKYRSVAVSSKKRIDIKKEHFGTFINLMSELKEVEESKQPSNAEKEKSQEKILRTNSNNTWVKVIVNNFSEEGKEIESSRVENYIVKDRPLPKNSHKCEIHISPKKVQ